MEEEFEDTKGAIRNRISKENRQHNVLSTINFKINLLLNNLHVSRKHIEDNDIRD